MAKKTVEEPVSVEDLVNDLKTAYAVISQPPPEDVYAIVALDNFKVKVSLIIPALNLAESGIITVADGAITWRAGHLEHIANLFAGDPVTTERNYADDLAVARSYSAETWASLLEATK